ncbi:MAG: hypothetical protein RJQ00_01830 [Vicingaceae bacterium]
MIAIGGLEYSLFISLGIAIFVFITLELIDGFGKRIPIRELMSFIVFLQLFISPLITYDYFNNEAVFRMYVEKELYMWFILPALCAFCLGLFINAKQSNNEPLLQNLHFGQKNQHLGFIFIVSGIFFYVFRSVVPPTLFFIFHLGGLLRFVGAFILLFSDNRYRYFWILLVFGEFSLSIVRGGVFYDLFVWFGFLFMFLELRWQSSFGKKMVYFIMGFAIVYLIQIVKSEYRAVIWDDTTTIQRDREEVFLDVATQKLDERAAFTESSNLDNFVSRLNIGWVVSKVMEHTPLREPFANGELLKKDIKNVLLPRFLFPNKASTGGKQNQEKFRRFTGIKLVKETTMRIGAFGDAYVNFGVVGGWICMFCLGLLFNLTLKWFLNSARKDKTLLLWIPLVFSYAIRMSDIQVILNFTFKAFLFFILIRFVIRQFGFGSLETNTVNKVE